MGKLSVRWFPWMLMPEDKLKRVDIFKILLIRSLASLNISNSRWNRGSPLRIQIKNLKQAVESLWFPHPEEVQTESIYWQSDVFSFYFDSKGVISI